MVMSMMCFHQTLPQNTQESLIRSNMIKKPKLGGRSSWWPFSRGTYAKDMTDLVCYDARSPSGQRNFFGLPNYVAGGGFISGYE